LASFPGPKLYGGSDIPWIIHAFRGDWPRKWTELHNKYGPIVRVGVSELSFTNPAAWSDIYGQQPGLRAMEKSGGSSSEGFGTQNIVNADAKTHPRQRRVLSYAFGDKALREREGLIAQYVDLLMKRLHDKAASDDTVDITAWFNYTTFDILGDLAFSESFHCLENSRYHPWILMKISNMKMVVWKNLVNRYVPVLGSLMRLFATEVMAQSDEVIRLSKRRASQRLTLETSRPDFMTHMLQHSNERNGMTTAEVEANAYVLIIAGSETTATLLTGAVFYLLLNPAALARLVKEIRSSFSAEADITDAAVSKLPYLSAVFNETFRLYPPVDGASNRVVPEGGAFIDGQFVPGGTRVGIPVTAAYQCRHYFRKPNLFIPERWSDRAYDSDEKAVLQPFGVGPRNCIGRTLAYMEMRLIMSRLLWNFDIELLPGQKNWSDQKLFILWDKGPLNIRLNAVERK